MALTLEMFVPGNNKWTKLADISPGASPGSFSNNTGEGREVYVFECLQDNSASVIYRSKAGVDVEMDPGRAIVTTGLDVVKTLRVGDKPYEIQLKTDRSSGTKRILFTHS